MIYATVWRKHGIQTNRCFIRLICWIYDIYFYTKHFAVTYVTIVVSYRILWFSFNEKAWMADNFFSLLRVNVEKYILRVINNIEDNRVFNIAFENITW